MVRTTRQSANREYRLGFPEKALLRQEVRRRLVSTRPTRSRLENLWSLANTKFVIWLLSALVISTTTWSYALVRDSFTQSARNQDLIRYLDAEIAGRLEASMFWLEGRRIAILPTDPVLGVWRRSYV